MKVAFVGTHNSCRSQIAEGFGRALFSDMLECYSAGTNIADRVNPDAVRLMIQYTGIDISGQYPKMVNDIPGVDIVITMGCGVQCPALPCKERYDCGLEDSTGKEDAVFLRVMTEMKKELTAFVQTLDHDQ